MKNKQEKYQNTQISHSPSSDDTPSVVHRSSIDTPSKRWTCDGVTMEYRWSIYLGKAEKQRTFLLGKSAVFEIKKYREKTMSSTSFALFQKY